MNVPKPIVLRNIQVRLASNTPGFFRQYRYWLGAAAVAAAADLTSTVVFMLQDGVNTELHPVIRAAAILLGPVAGPILGKLGQMIAVIAIAIFFRSRASQIFLLVIFLYSWAAWYNTWGFQFGVPRLVLIFDRLGF